MIERNNDPARVPDLFHKHILKGLDRQHGRAVVAHGIVYLSYDELAGMSLFPEARPSISSLIVTTYLTLILMENY